MEQHYITAQEFWQITSIVTTVTITSISLIVGIIMTMIKGSINTKVFSMIDNSEKKIQNKIFAQEEDLKGVKENYLDRFDKLNKLLMEINVKLSEIKTSVNYITEEQNRIRRKHGD